MFLRKLGDLGSLKSLNINSLNISSLNLSSLNKKFSYFIVAVLSLGLANFGFAADYSKLVVFGDSLSDSGNLFAQTQFPPPPYNQRITNELVWPEYLSPKLGLNYSQTNNLAVAGALTNTTNSNSEDLGKPLSGVQQQIDSYLAANPNLDPNALYMYWAGANNLFTVTPQTPPIQALGIVTSAALDIGNQVQALISAGAKNIVVIGMPDFALIPRVTALGGDSVANAGQLTTVFNQALENSLANLTQGVHFYSVAQLFKQVVANPAAYGFSNLSDPCLNTQTNAVCSNPNSYLFWDDIHMSATGHKVLSDAIYAMVRQARFDTSSQSLNLPALSLNGDASSIYDVSLSFNSQTGHLQLSKADPTSGVSRLASLANFDSKTGILKVTGVRMKNAQGSDDIVNASFELLPEGQYKFRFLGFE